MANRYHASYKATSTRPNAPADTITFYAADDAAAEAIATVIDGYVTSKRVSLVKAIFFDNTGEYPDGTPVTLTSILADEQEDVFKFRLRNFGAGVIDSDVVAFLKGEAGGGSSGVSALSGPVGLPNTLNAVASVRNVTAVDKSAAGL